MEKLPFHDHHVDCVLCLRTAIRASTSGDEDSMEKVPVRDHHFDCVLLTGEFMLFTSQVRAKTRRKLGRENRGCYAT